MKQKTFYHIILDQSGSMQDCIDTTISGYNEQVQMYCVSYLPFSHFRIRVK